MKVNQREIKNWRDRNECDGESDWERRIESRERKWVRDILFIGEREWRKRWRDIKCLLCEWVWKRGR